jgi:heat shock protein HslJ
MIARKLTIAISILVIQVATNWAATETIVRSLSCSPFLQTSEEQSRKGDMKLENTYWRLIELGGKPVPETPRRREAYLQLNSEGKILLGSGGCNTMRGGYNLNGESLKFTQIATTRMACTGPYMSQESAFLKALGDTDSFNLSGDKLELFGEGKSLMRLEARRMK